MSLSLQGIEIFHRVALRSLRREEQVTADGRVLTLYSITIDPEEDDVPTLNRRWMLPDTVVQQFMSTTGEVRTAMVEETIVAYAVVDGDSCESTDTSEELSNVVSDELIQPTPAVVITEPTVVPHDQPELYVCADRLVPDGFQQRLLTHQIHQTSHPEQEDPILQKFTQRANGTANVCSYVTPEPRDVGQEESGSMAVGQTVGATQPNHLPQSTGLKARARTLKKAAEGIRQSRSDRPQRLRTLVPSVPSLASTLFDINVTIKEVPGGSSA